MNGIRGAWVRNAITLIRWSRTLAYVAVSISGFTAIMMPPASVRATTDHPLVTYVWAGCLGLSALICALGSVTDRWAGEYVGLIPLSLFAAVFAISALSRGGPGVAGGAFLIGFFWLLASRWQEVALLRVEAARKVRHNEMEQE